MLSWQASHGSQHRQQCCCALWFSIQTHVAPSQAPPTRVISSLPFPERSRIVPVPSPALSLLRSKLRSKGSPQTTWFPAMAATPVFKSQHKSSAALVWTPPTIGYTCQHFRIFSSLSGLPQLVRAGVAPRHEANHLQALTQSL